MNRWRLVQGLLNRTQLQTNVLNRNLDSFVSEIYLLLWVKFEAYFSPSDYTNYPFLPLSTNQLNNRLRAQLFAKPITGVNKMSEMVFRLEHVNKKST